MSIKHNTLYKNRKVDGYLLHNSMHYRWSAISLRYKQLHQDLQLQKEYIIGKNDVLVSLKIITSIMAQFNTSIVQMKFR